MEKLSINPAASAPLTVRTRGSFDKWSDTLAAYRLFDNPAVTPEAILQSHGQATLARIVEHPVVLILQDTTELDFTKHPPKDARCLNKADRFGFYDHTHLAVTPGGMPLGVVGTELFDRSPESLGKTLQRRDLPIEEKESFRWLSGYRLAQTVSQQCPQTQIVNVADREADMYDIFLEAQSESGSDFVIRSKAFPLKFQRPAGGPPGWRSPCGAQAPAQNHEHGSKEDRCTNERVPPSEHGTRYAVYRKARDEVRDSPMRVRQMVSLPQTPKRCARQAELEVRACTVTLRHPKHRSDLVDVDCSMVYVQEINGPNDGTDVEWWLITSLPVDSVEDIERVINYYKTRWTIEVYFRVLKTGCPGCVDRKRGRHPARNNGPPEDVPCVLSDHRVASPLPDTPESRATVASLHRRVPGLRMAIRLARHHTAGHPRQTTTPVGIRASAGEPWRLQQPPLRSTARPPTHLDRPPTNGRLHPRLAIIRTYSEDLCINVRFPPARE